MSLHCTKKARLFLDYQSCVQCSLKKQNGKIAMHYFIGSWIYKDEACKLQNRLWNDHSPQLQGAPLNVHILRWNYVSMVVHDQGLGVWKRDEIWGSDWLKNNTFRDDQLTVVHSQHWHITRGGCPENVTRIHISEGEPEGWNNILCSTLVSNGKTPAEIYQPFKISLYLNHQKGRNQRWEREELDLGAQNQLSI